MDGKDNKIESNISINVGGNLMDFSVPRIMGIINVNDDSFYGGSRAKVESDILSRAERFLMEGADIIDVGAISTRPNADLFNVNVELERLIPAIKAIKREFPDALLSVDTFRSEVAEKAVEEGGDIINDVYGGRFDKDMFETVGKLKVPYVLMHSRGFAGNMKEKTGYKNIINDIISELDAPLNTLRESGVKDIIIDPGFGFAKTISENYKLLNDLALLKALGYPLLVGLSRKSMIYKKLKTEPSDALNGTIVLNTLAYMKGANIFRVHDVKPVKEMITLLS